MKLGNERVCGDSWRVVCDERRPSRYSADDESRLFVDAGRAATFASSLSSELLPSHWLPGTPYGHLPMNYGPLSRWKFAAVADCTAPPFRRCAPDVQSEEDVDVVMTTASSPQRHLLIDLQQRLQRTRMYKTFWQDAICQFRLGNVTKLHRN